MKEAKTFALLQVGMGLNEYIQRTGCGYRGKTKDVFPPFPQPLLLRNFENKI